MKQATLYRGRFAPSPTGPLHFGSLIAATGSYLQAKHQGGDWFIRIDDIDPTREVIGAADKILFTLEAFGFEWDHPVTYQSHNTSRYQDAVNELIKKKQAYRCHCSRRIIQTTTGQTHPIYPGTCRNSSATKINHAAIRLLTHKAIIQFDDLIQGKQHAHLEKETGDFIIQRRDNYFAYHLASAIDDAEQGITEVVRGCDLLNSTPCQIHIQNILSLTTPRYCHLAIAKNRQGQKLSKQSHAKPLEVKIAPVLLLKTLIFLGQSPPEEMRHASLEEIWSWAIKHWDINLLTPVRGQPSHK